WPLKCSSERKSHPKGREMFTSLTLNQKLEMIKLSEESIKSQYRLKAGLLAPVSQVVNAKEKLLKEIESLSGLDRRSNEPRHSFHGSLIQSKVLTLFNSVMAERGEGATEEEFEASRDGFMFKKEAVLCNVKVQGEAASADAKAAACYTEDLAKIIDEGGYTKQQVFNVDENFSRTFLVREEKSMPGFKVSKDRLTFMLGANAAADFKLKPVLIYYPENPGAFKSYAKSALYSINRTKMVGYLFIAWFTEKKVSFKILLLIIYAPSYSRGLVQIYKPVNVVFMPINTTSIQQEVILTFKTYYLRNAFNKAIAAIDSDSDGSWQNKWKTFWKGVTILDAIKDICDSWEEVKISTEVWKKLISILMDGFEGFKTSVADATSDVLEIARELELEVEPKDVTELLQSYDKTLKDEELLLVVEQIKWFIVMKSTPGNDAVNIIEMTIKDLEYYINFVGKVAAEFERIDSSFERCSTVGKMISNSIRHYEIFCKRKSRSKWQTSLLFYFQKLPQPPQPSPTTTLISQQTSLLRQDPPPAKRLQLAEGSN
uniref:Uncharacterized protein n=1 Tax=Chlorocebus sabaeus TaxID=60711 RepID=A0A0D9RQS2_CHLSB